MPTRCCGHFFLDKQGGFPHSSALQHQVLIIRGRKNNAAASFRKIMLDYLYLMCCKIYFMLRFFKMKYAR